MGDIFERLKEDLQQRDKMAGMRAADLLMMPDDERRIVQALARRGDLTLDELCQALDRREAAVLATLAMLREKGFARELEIKGHRVWRTYYARRKPSTAKGSIWDSLAEKTDKPVGESRVDDSGKADALVEDDDESKDPRADSGESEPDNPGSAR